MKSLNNTATRIFSKLLVKLNNEEQINLTSESFRPLTIVKLHEGIMTEFGEAELYSLMHSYVQNGDLMRDPEMTFLVIDSRIDSTDYNSLLVIPTYYRQDSFGMDNESVRIVNNEVISVIPVWQHEHCRFANQWMKDIKEHGFLD